MTAFKSSKIISNDDAKIIKKVSGATLLRKNFIVCSKKKESYIAATLFEVVSPGIEPGTQGFSVLCSTN